MKAEHPRYLHLAYKYLPTLDSLYLIDRLSTSSTSPQKRSFSLSSAAELISYKVTVFPGNLKESILLKCSKLFG